MKTTIEINGKKVEITLTKDQVAAIKKADEKITDRIKSFDDVIEELGEKDIEVIEYRKLIKVNVATHILNNQMAVMLAKALNEGWTPDWSNSNEYKYFAYFRMGSSGSGFSYLGCDNWPTASTVGSRLCFKSAELAKYAGNQFTEIFKNFMI